MIKTYETITWVLIKNMNDKFSTRSKKIKIGVRIIVLREYQKCEVGKIISLFNY